MLKRIRIIILLMLTGASLPAQTGQPARISMPFPVYSQYLQNGLVINPAYAGSREALNLFTSIRYQWMGMQSGSPLFETLSMHSMLKNDHVGLGLTGQYLSYGRTTGTSVYAIYSYHLTFGKTRLSLGLRGGVDMANTNYKGLFLESNSVADPDPAFSVDAKPYIMPNVGAGFYLYNKKFFFGASVPQFFSYVKSSDGKVSFNTFQKFDIQATAGCLLKFSDGFKFKPSVFVDYSLDPTRKLRMDLNGNFIISDLIWIGGSYRIGEKCAVGILQLQVNPKLMFGISYDYPMGTLSPPFTLGSAEAILRYEFGYKVTASNPRYF